MAVTRHCPLRTNPCAKDCEWFILNPNPMKQGCILKDIRRRLIGIESYFEKIVKPDEKE